ncbi:hypothetical protein JSE7799_02993 [Jannaschia seosinensis]|uniref:Phage integrase family protein n=1 Tax=Jannaschia seosinensis TaxID=313367 RepID=A0A0M7BEE3_9RHOB|nr:hypothetical protein [Jannaschia seosinensis]CUH40263.1 hypothetical protein JSE7799_02993 [Jannaschia seosinensis]
MTTMAIGPHIMASYLEELGCLLVEAHEVAREVAPQLTAEAAAFEAACSQAAIDALRHALSLRDREQARQPLRDVADRLGLALDEADEDWSRLAYRALRVMLDASEENARRDAGVFDTPSPFFRSSRAARIASRSAMASATVAPPARPASPRPIVTVAPVLPEVTTSVPSEPMHAPTADSVVQPQAVKEEKPVEPQHAPATVSEAITVANMTLEDYFDLYIAKKLEGFTDDFGEEEVPDPAVGEGWRKSSKNNMEVGKRLWVGLLGNRPLGEISDADIREAKKKFRRLPETHGKSCSETRDLDVLIAETDAEEKRNIEEAVAAAKRAGGSEAKIERAQLDNLIPRIRVETIVKHTRALNRPAKMMVKLGMLETSPFQKHMITNKSAEAMRKSEETRDRRPWDDRIYKLLAAPVFRGNCDGVGDPMFWAPLMALLGGGREEEILQLSPDDFETTGGIHYYRLRNMPGNSIKSDASERVIPVHPELVRLGLIELVELRRREGEPRLFPHLKRGKHKETFTELFTKEFTRYRQAHKVYWIGLDFHAVNGGVKTGHAAAQNQASDRAPSAMARALAA